MDWKKYEAEIFENLKQAYPNASIKFNQKIVGRYSKAERQIDVLIEARIAGKKIRLVIDGKYYTKKVDVKDVDSFISMVEDIDAAQGIMITSKGYSEAAINRAYYGPADIELDILNFNELKQFQGVAGTAYSVRHGAIIPAPFGWIIDGERRRGSIANLYQRGKSYEEALKDGEFMYVNIVSFDSSIKKLDDVLDFQEKNTLRFHPRAKFEYSESIERFDKSKTLLRKILREETNLEEYTGFIEFDEFCLFCVLLTPEQLKTKNIRKLEYVIENLMPINVDLTNVKDSKIRELRNLMEESTSNEEKAEVLISIAEIHREFKEFEEAKVIYEESINLFPENYSAKLGLLEIGYNSLDRDLLISNFYALAPGNRQICDDLVRLGLESGQIDFTEDFLISKLEEEQSNFESLGNIYFSLADLFYTEGLWKKSLIYFKLAKSNFSQCFEKSHPALSLIEDLIQNLEK